LGRFKSFTTALFEGSRTYSTIRKKQTSIRFYKRDKKRKFPELDSLDRMRRRNCLYPDSEFVMCDTVEEVEEGREKRNGWGGGGDGLTLYS